MTRLMTTGLLADLDGLEQGPGNTDLLQRWQAAETALSPFASIRAIVEDGLAPRVSAPAKDAVLLSLIRLAQSDFRREASLCILAAMDSKVTRLTRSQSAKMADANGFIEGYYTVQSVMFEQVVSYNVERGTRGVAGKLALNTLRAVRKGCVDRRHWTDRERANWHGGLEAAIRCLPLEEERAVDFQRPNDGVFDLVAARLSSSFGGREAPSRSDGLAAALSWARERGVVSGEEVALLYEVYVSPGFQQPLSGALERAASIRGVSVSVIRSRCSRATRRIASAISEHSASAESIRTAHLQAA